MLFNTYEFLLGFLSVTLVGYWYLKNQPVWQQSFLILCGLFFYGYAGVHYLALLLSMTLITFLTGRYLLPSPGYRQVGLLVGLSNLGILLFFKYGTRMFQTENILLPLGISFYTFNLLSYVLDIYREIAPPAHSLRSFMAYTLFFPTLLAGPLIRYQTIREQQESIREPMLNLAIFSFTMGLAKKVLIADTLAPHVTTLFDAHAHLGLVDAWLAAFGYTFQLYYDFSGYSDMAIGLGYFLGYQLPINFRAPYAAINIADFWRRWHISLSSWFRDYLFYPLSRALLRRDQRRHPDLVRTISLIITMTLTGIWHGSLITFAIWGCYHGLLLAGYEYLRLREWNKLPLWLAWAVTLTLVLLGWVIFRSTSLEMAVQLYQALLGFKGLTSNVPITLFNLDSARATLLLLCPLLLYLSTRPVDTHDLKTENNVLSPVMLAVLFIITLLLLGQNNPFLYLQF